MFHFIALLYYFIVLANSSGKDFASFKSIKCKPFTAGSPLTQPGKTGYETQDGRLRGGFSKGSSNRRDLWLLNPILSPTTHYFYTI